MLLLKAQCRALLQVSGSLFSETCRPHPSSYSALCHTKYYYNNQQLLLLLLLLSTPPNTIASTKHCTPPTPSTTHPISSTSILLYETARLDYILKCITNPGGPKTGNASHGIHKGQNHTPPSPKKDPPVDSLKELLCWAFSSPDHLKLWSQ